MANATHSPQALPFTKANGKMHSPYGGRAKAQRAGISKHITAVKYKTYNCKITKLHSTKQQSMNVE